MGDGTLTIGFGDQDGEQTFASWDDLQNWINKERALWEWLSPASPQVNVNSIAQQVQNTFTNIIQQISSSRSSGHEPLSLHGLLNNAYHPTNGYLRRSDGKDAAVAFDARRAAGDEAGAFAYAFVINKATLPQAVTLAHLKGAMMAAIPALDEPTHIAERLSNERANYKASQRDGIKRLQTALGDQQSEFDELVRRGKQIAKKALSLRQERWTKQQHTWAESAASAVAQIQATEEAYKIAMGLQAPVEYWRTKADTHGKAEGRARVRLYWFFPLALLLLISSFAGAAALLLYSEDTQIPATVYIIISGGLASVAALSFWVGRLLTKLYLSEHHLRHDAEERAVMTTTYLALTKEKAAEDTDRQIILNSLFRPTSDGLVREDGPAEISVAGLLARLGTK